MIATLRGTQMLPAMPIADPLQMLRSYRMNMLTLLTMRITAKTLKKLAGA